MKIRSLKSSRFQRKRGERGEEGKRGKEKERDDSNWRWSSILYPSRRPEQRRWWHPTPVLLPGKPHGQRSLVGCKSMGSQSRTRLSDFTFTFPFHVLEKEMATYSSVLAWKIPGTGEPGGLLSMGSQRVRQDWSDLAAAAADQRPDLKVKTRG